MPSISSKPKRPRRGKQNGTRLTDKSDRINERPHPAADLARRGERKQPSFPIHESPLGKTCNLCVAVPLPPYKDYPKLIRADDANPDDWLVEGIAKP